MTLFNPTIRLIKYTIHVCIAESLDDVCRYEMGFVAPSIRYQTTIVPEAQRPKVLQKLHCTWMRRFDWEKYARVLTLF